jgi:hypothetical protein
MTIQLFVEDKTRSYPFPSEAQSGETSPISLLLARAYGIVSTWSGPS